MHAFDKDLNSLINRLEHDSLLAIEWDENRNTKLNQDQSYLIVSGHNNENVFPSALQSMIWEAENQKLVDIIIYRKLNLIIRLLLYAKKLGKKLCLS